MGTWEREGRDVERVGEWGGILLTLRMMFLPSLASDVSIAQGPSMKAGHKSLIAYIADVEVKIPSGLWW